MLLSAEQIEVKSNKRMASFERTQRTFSPGFDSGWALKKPSADWYCHHPKCKESNRLLKEALEIPNCKHKICSSHHAEIGNQMFECPVCMEEHNLEDDPAADNLEYYVNQECKAIQDVGKMEVKAKCEYGCGQQGLTFNNIEEHLRTCEFGLGKCSVCSVSMTYKQWMDRGHDQICHPPTPAAQTSFCHACKERISSYDHYLECFGDCPLGCTREPTLSIQQHFMDSHSMQEVLTAVGEISGKQSCLTDQQLAVVDICFALKGQKTPPNLYDVILAFKKADGTVDLDAFLTFLKG